MLDDDNREGRVLRQPLVHHVYDPLNERTAQVAYIHYTSHVIEAESKSSLLATSFNFINCITGAGILTLSSGFSEIGYVSGILCLVFFGGISFLSCMELYWLLNLTGRHTYSGMAEELFGKKGKYYVDAVQILYSFGAIIGYAVLIGNQLHTVMSRVALGVEGFPGFLIDYRFLLLFVALFITLPVSLKKDLHSLRYTSFFSICCIMYLSAVIISQSSWNETCGALETSSYFYCNKGTQQCTITSVPLATGATYENITSCLDHCGAEAAIDNEPAMSKFKFDFRALTALPLFSFAFTCQVQFPPLIRELENPSPSRVVSLTLGGLLFTMMLYIAVALAGYMSFCQYVLDNVLDCFRDTDSIILSTRVAITGVLCCCFPLFSHAIRGVINVLIVGDAVQENNTRRDTIITVLIVAISTSVALAFDSLGTVLGLTGAVAGTQLLMIIPNAMYCKWNVDKGLFWRAVLPFLGCILGVFISIISVIATLQG